MTRLDATRASRWALAAAILGLGGVAGCGESYEQETAEVAGTVTLDGRPVTTGWVMFTPRSGRAAKGAIGPDGRFTLGTYDAADGAIVGPHQVTIIARDKGAPGSELPGKSLVPERYSSPTNSGLAYHVKPGEANTADFPLTSR